MSNNLPNALSSKPGQGGPESGSLRFLRTVAWIALAIGATGSLVFMFRAGQQTPRFLLVLFTFWVLAPFAALLWAQTVSKRWSLATRVTLYCMELLVALGSLAIYSELINVRPAGSANAFLFVAVPPALLLFSTIVISAAAFLSGRRSHRGGGT